jgi:hypothetical protein
MTDRELLELAAKAAGIYLAFGGPDGDMARRTDTWDNWNPLTDDGDALRLAVKLGMDVCFGANYVIVRGFVHSPLVNNANDPYAATRRAIVITAAEIGKAMP